MKLRFTRRTHAHHFFDREEKKRIAEAIAAAEGKTSGEIKVHVEAESGGDPIAKAQKVFAALGMDQTAARNGVLIYLDPGKNQRLSCAKIKAMMQAAELLFGEPMTLSIGGDWYQGVKGGDSLHVRDVKVSNVGSKYIQFKDTDGQVQYVKPWEQLGSLKAGLHTVRIERKG